MVLFVCLQAALKLQLEQFAKDISQAAEEKASVDRRKVDVESWAAEVDTKAREQAATETRLEELRVALDRKQVRALGSHAQTRCTVSMLLERLTNMG